MSLSKQKIIMSAFFAITLILLTFYYSKIISDFPELVVSLLSVLPYILLLAIIANSITHRKTRELNLAVSLIISFWLLKNLIWPTDTNDATATILFVLVGPLLSVNFLFISKISEKGFYNKNGLRHLYLILFEAFLLIWFVNYTPELLLKYLYYPYFVAPIFDSTPMYQSTIIINSIAFVILFINAIIKQKVIMIAYLGAFIAIILAQHFINTPTTSMMFFTVACLILIFSLSLNSFRLSKVDVITDLPSLRSFKKQLSHLDNRYCIALVEVDDFDDITDEYGQDISEQILRMIASRSSLLGRKGFPYRYGLKEFSLIFYDMQLAEANKYLATLCDSIANEPFLIRSKNRSYFKPSPSVISNNVIPKPIPISVSVGIAEKQSHHDTPSEVLNTAQQALDRAKEQQQYFATM